MGRNEVRWRPGQEASFVSRCSNLRSFGSKGTAMKKVLVTFRRFPQLFGPILIRLPVICAPHAPISLRSVTYAPGYQTQANIETKEKLSDLVELTHFTTCEPTHHRLFLFRKA